MDFEEMINDVNHWQSFSPPYCPNQQEVDIFAYYSKDYSPVCLTGMTKELIHLCDYAVDLNPIEIGKPTIKCDWREMKECGAIIGDGILNLIGLDYYKKAMEISNRFICRVFMEKLPKMKYAEFFPKEFPDCSKIIKTQENIVIVIWNKNE